MTSANHNEAPEMVDTLRQPKIVVIGGGTGSPIVLKGLKPYTDNLTSIVTMFDSGGSSGVLTNEFGYPPLGDLRRCLMALAEDNEVTEALRPLVEFRFDPNSSLKGHSLGNLLMAALTSVHSGVQEAVDEMARMLNVRGQVTPVTLEQADLCAELENGDLVYGESAIDLRSAPHPRIRRVFLNRKAAANPRAVEAIMDADAIVLGPGDLYTSIIPNLLADGISDAIAATQATKIYVSNLMTKPGETDGFTVSDFVCEVQRYLGGPYVDWVVANNFSFPKHIRERYEEQTAMPVPIGDRQVRQQLRWLISDDIAEISPENKVRHSPEVLARSLLGLVGSPKNSSRKPEFTASASL